MNIQVSVEKKSPILHKLSVKVPAVEVQARLENRFQVVQQKATLKGFRPGQVPMPMVKQMFGKDVRHDLYHDLMKESLSEAIRKEKLRSVGAPRVEGADAHDQHQLDESKDFNFTAEIEVIPELQIKGYQGVKVAKEKVSVSKDEIENILKQAQEEEAVGEPIEDQAHGIEIGNLADIHFEGGVVTETGLDKRPGMSGSRVFEVGSKQFIEGFEENLIGLKSGEAKTFKVRFPADYFEKTLANAEAEFSVKVSGIQKKAVPSLDDAFATRLGYGSVSAWREKVKSLLEQQKEQQASRKQRSEVVDAILKKNPFDVPTTLVQAQTRSLAQEVAQQLKQQGFNDQMVQEALMQELANLKTRAESQVRASLALESIAKQEKIELTPDEITAEIQKIAAQANVDEARVREFYLQENQRREDFEFKLLEEKTFKFLLDK